jgi:hypothetical protein
MRLNSIIVPLSGSEQQLAPWPATLQNFNLFSALDFILRTVIASAIT